MVPMKKLVIQRSCAGECGSPITYEAAETVSPEYRDTYVPVVRVTSGSRIAYAGGHLCNACERLVSAALEPGRVQQATPRRAGHAVGKRPIGQTALVE